MARGCPVVCARTGALPEVCGDAAVYVDPQQPRSIADALLHVLRNPDLARALVERGRARARALTWEASARAHLAVFDCVARLDLTGRGAPASGPNGRMEADVLP
jgi:glycosyltransferase involved in cell wall biosynthesis